MEVTAICGISHLFQTEPAHRGIPRDIYGRSLSVLAFDNIEFRKFPPGAKIFGIRRSYARKRRRRGYYSVGKLPYVFLISLSLYMHAPCAVSHQTDNAVTLRRTVHERPKSHALYRACNVYVY
jgi:hypothetical protein